MDFLDFKDIQDFADLPEGAFEEFKQKEEELEKDNREKMIIGQPGLIR